MFQGTRPQGKIGTIVRTKKNVFFEIVFARLHGRMRQIIWTRGGALAGGGCVRECIQEKLYSDVSGTVRELFSGKVEQA